MQLSADSRVLGITGLPASGKNTFGQIAVQYDYSIFVMGDVIRNACKENGLVVNRENSNKIMLDLRKEYGSDVVAVKTAEKVTAAINAGETHILIDGIRSLTEVKYFQQLYPNFQLVAIHASPQERLQRVMARARTDDSFSESSFLERDQIELSVGIGSVIAMADYLIVSPNSLNAAKELYEEFFNSI